MTITALTLSVLAMLQLAASDHCATRMEKDLASLGLLTTDGERTIVQPAFMAELASSARLDDRIAQILLAQHDPAQHDVVARQVLAQAAPDPLLLAAVAGTCHPEMHEWCDQALAARWTAADPGDLAGWFYRIHRAWQAGEVEAAEQLMIEAAAMGQHPPISGWMTAAMVNAVLARHPEARAYAQGVVILAMGHEVATAYGAMPLTNTCSHAQAGTAFADACLTIARRLLDSDSSLINLATGAALLERLGEKLGADVGLLALSAEQQDRARRLQEAFPNDQLECDPEAALAHVRHMMTIGELGAIERLIEATGAQPTSTAANSRGSAPRKDRQSMATISSVPSAEAVLQRRADEDPATAKVPRDEVPGHWWLRVLLGLAAGIGVIAWLVRSIHR